VTQNLGERHQVVPIVGQELFGEAVPENVRIDLRATPFRSAFVQLEVEVEPGLMLKFQGAFSPITAPAHHDERGKKADHFEIPAQFLRVPDLPMLGFERFTAAGLGIDFHEALATKGFGWVGHGDLLGVGFPWRCTTKLWISLLKCRNGTS